MPHYKDPKNWFFALSWLLALAIFSGIALLETVICLFTLFFLIDSYQKKDWQFARSQFFQVLLAFCFYAVLRNLLVGFEKSAFEPLNLVRFYLIGLCFRRYLVDKQSIRTFCLGHFVVVAVVIIYTWGQIFYGKDFYGHVVDYNNSMRLWNFGGKMVLGAALLYSQAVVASYLIISAANRKELIKAALFALSLLLTIVVSGERAATLIYIFCLSMSLFYMQKVPPLRYVIIIFCIALAGVLYFAPAGLIARFVQILAVDLFNHENSSYWRIFNASLKLFLMKPIFGFGSGHYNLLCETLLPGHYCAFHPHNLYLELLTSFGVCGLCLFALIFYSLCKNFKLNSQNNHVRYFEIACIIFIAAKLLPFPSGKMFMSWVSVYLWSAIGFLSVKPLKLNVK
jgi:O-antigen ligase